MWLPSCIWVSGCVRWELNLLSFWGLAVSQICSSRRLFELWDVCLSPQRMERLVSEDLSLSTVFSRKNVLRVFVFVAPSR